MFVINSLKEELIKSVYASTKDFKETNEQYQKHVKMLEKVTVLENKQLDFLTHYYLGN